MKAFYFIIIIVLTTVNIGFCQIKYDTIPNGNFERWKIINGIENPDGWETNNNQLTKYVEKDSSALKGKISMRINANGWARVQIPVQFSPFKYIGGVNYVAIYNIPKPDIFSVEVLYRSNNNTIDTGLIEMKHSISNYMYFYTPVPQLKGYQTDSIRITFKGGTVPGNYMIIDDVWLRENIASINSDKKFKQYWNIFSTDQTVIFEPKNFISASDISIINVTGQTVFSKNNCTQPFSIPLKPGIYFCRITHNNTLIQTDKVIVN